MAISHQQVMDQVHSEGIDTNIRILCRLGLRGVTPFWIINESVYGLLSIPYTFLPDVQPPLIPIVDSYFSLTIPRVTRDLNGVTFQCAIYSENGVIFGQITRIRVIPSKFINNYRGA